MSESVSPKITVNVSAEMPRATVHIHVTSDTDGLATREYVDKKIEDFEGGTMTETDPTVPEWAKQPEKPTYTADEVGAQPKGDYALKSELPEAPVQSVNGKTGKVQLSAADVNARPDTWTPTAAETGADAAGSAAAEGAKALAAANAYADQQIAAIPTPDVSGQIGQHNADEAAHPAIRTMITELAARLNALADSDDTTLDQLSEIVAYIKSNKSLIDAITTGKVSVGDIVNNLTTNAAAKPLSAAQGVVLKAMIEAITVPTKLSELTSDAAHRTVTDEEKATWDAKSEFSGAYGDLTGKPTIPTVPENVSAFDNDAGYLTAVPGEYVTEAELAAKGYLTEHQDISGKLDADKLPEAVEDALEQAKASGEFDGEDGIDGVSPTVSVSKSGKVTTISITDKDGTKTATINDGADGDPGQDGYTPVKGTDYFTEADQEEIVQQVIAALGTPVFGTVDADNNIILTGELADGIYTLKYEDAEGNQTEIGTVEIHSDETAYNNVLTLAVDSDDTPFNGGKGYAEGYRFNSVGELTELSTSVYTGFIPYDGSSTIRIFGLNQSSLTSQTYIWLYDSEKAKLTANPYFTLVSLVSNHGATLTEETVDGVTAYMLTIDLEAIYAVKDWVAESFYQAAFFRFNVISPNLDTFAVYIGE